MVLNNTSTSYQLVLLARTFTNSHPWNANSHAFTSSLSHPIRLIPCLQLQYQTVLIVTVSATVCVRSFGFPSALSTNYGNGIRASPLKKNLTIKDFKATSFKILSLKCTHLYQQIFVSALCCHTNLVQFRPTYLVKLA